MADQTPKSVSPAARGCRHWVFCAAGEPLQSPPSEVPQLEWELQEPVRAQALQSHQCRRVHTVETGGERTPGALTPSAQAPWTDTLLTPRIQLPDSFTSCQNT